MNAKHWKWHSVRKHTESVIEHDDGVTKVATVARFTGPGHAEHCALACAAPALAEALRLVMAARSKHGEGYDAVWSIPCHSITWDTINAALALAGIRNPTPINPGVCTCGCATSVNVLDDDGGPTGTVACLDCGDVRDGITTEEPTQ